MVCSALKSQVSLMVKVRKSVGGTCGLVKCCIFLTNKLKGIINQNVSASKLKYVVKGHNYLSMSCDNNGIVVCRQREYLGASGLS